MVHLLLSACLVFTLGLALPAAASSTGELYRQAKAATVLIVAVNDTTRSVSIGSGFFADNDGLLVTNAHVIEDHTRLIVYVQDQQVYPAPAVVAVDADLDLAALRIQFREKGIRKLPLAQNTPEEGEEVIAVGYPRITDILQMGFVLHPTVVSGHANGIAEGRSRTKGRSTPFIQTTANFNFGNSGGPLVSLQSHEVSGMVVHTVPYLERAKDRAGAPVGNVVMKSGIGYSIPAPVIRGWLTANDLWLPSDQSPAPSLEPEQRTAEQQANTSFATGHLLHTIAVVLHQDADLLNLAAYHYENAAALRADAPWVNKNLGLVYASLGRWERALQAYNKALEQTPKDASILADVGLTLERMGNRDRAAETYRKAISVNPRSETAHNNLGGLLLKAGKLDEAIQEFRQALNCDSGSAMAWYNLGLALEAKGLREDAVTTWESFLRKGAGSDTTGFSSKIREAVSRVKPLSAKARPVSGAHQ
jgi:hypothetical protein